MRRRFKDRLRNYKKSSTKEFWEIKTDNGTLKIIWKIFRICCSYNPNRKHCLLCLSEKYKIETNKRDNLLSTRNEIKITCRHRNDYKFANCDTID